MPMVMHLPGWRRRHGRQQETAPPGSATALGDESGNDGGLAAQPIKGQNDAFELPPCGQLEGGGDRVGLLLGGFPRQHRLPLDRNP